MFSQASLHRGSLGFATVVVLGVGAVAYAQLGGASGIVVPFQGTLHSGAEPVDGTADLSFDVFNQETGGGACQTVTRNAVPVSIGQFSTELSLSDACVRGRDVWLAISVDGNPVGDRQRVFPALAAMTSSSGDFHVAGDHDVDGTMASNVVDTSLVATDAIDVTGLVTIQEGATAIAPLEAGKMLVVTGNMGDGRGANGGIEFRHDNQTQGIGFGYNTIYATGSNPSQDLSLASRGTSPLRLNPDANAPVVVGGNLVVNGGFDVAAQSRSGNNISSYPRSLQRVRVVAPFTNSHYRSYTPISEALMASLCGDEDGCTVSLRMVEWGAGPVAAASRGPHHFDYGPATTSRPWRLSTDASALDGDGAVNHVLRSFDCYFTDGQYFQGNTATNDVGRGFGLLNTGDSYAAACELLIDD